MGKPGDKFSEELICRAFQFFLCVLQVFANLDTLGTVLLTFAAANAVGGGGGSFPGSGAHGVFFQRPELAFLEAAKVPGMSTFLGQGMQ